MGETSPTPATTAVEIIYDDWRIADELQDRIDEDPGRRGEKIAGALAQARAAGYEAGLAETQDAAHRAGYLEGRASLHIDEPGCAACAAKLPVVGFERSSCARPAGHDGAHRDADGETEWTL